MLNIFVFVFFFIGNVDNLEIAIEITNAIYVFLRFIVLLEERDKNILIFKDIDRTLILPLCKDILNKQELINYVWGKNFADITLDKLLACNTNKEFLEAFECGCVFELYTFDLKELLETYIFKLKYPENFTKCYKAYLDCLESDLFRIVN